MLELVKNAYIKTHVAWVDALNKMLYVEHKKAPEVFRCV